MLLAIKFAAFLCLLSLAACSTEFGDGRNPARAYAPIPASTLALFSQKDTDRSAAVLLRAYKKESEIELWKQAKDGRYVHIKTYPVCRWSGQLGPKKREGDRQVPEGFYTVTPSGMNPNSALWLSFNIGYPNPLDRSMGRDGGDIMVHGDCSSRGCFAMTDKQIEELYAVVREAFNNGQRAVQFQSFPFRMTPENFAKFRRDPNIAFWKNLKEGSDNFDVSKSEPRVGYCGGKYVFNAESGRNDPNAPCSVAAADPSISLAVAAKQRTDDRRVAELVQRGTPAVGIRYSDGSQNPSFRNSGVGYEDQRSMVAYADPSARGVGNVSRPEAIDDVQEFTVGEPATASTVAKSAGYSGSPAPSNRPVLYQKQLAGGEQSSHWNEIASSETELTNPATQVERESSTNAPLASSTGEIETTSTVRKDNKPFYKRWFGFADEATSATRSVLN